MFRAREADARQVLPSRSAASAMPAPPLLSLWPDSWQLLPRTQQRLAMLAGILAPRSLSRWTFLPSLQLGYL